MRFETKYDRAILTILLVVVVCFAGPPVFIYFSDHRAGLGLPLLPPALILITLSFMLPQYYEVRADGLFIRQGWRRVLIPYKSLLELQPTMDLGGNGTFSTDRVRILTAENRRYFIAPAEQERFMKEVSSRAPQLEWKGSGLAVPLLPASIM